MRIEEKRGKDGGLMGKVFYDRSLWGMSGKCELATNVCDDVIVIVEIKFTRSLSVKSNLKFHFISLYFYVCCWCYVTWNVKLWSRVSLDVARFVSFCLHFLFNSIFRNLMYANVYDKMLCMSSLFIIYYGMCWCCVCRVIIMCLLLYDLLCLIFVLS